jgi:predicted MFS family arabinose efflux permease
VTVIGLFGLVGLAGAIAAQRAGRLHDRGLTLPATGIAWVLVMIAFVIAALGSGSVTAIIVTILVLDIAIQGHNILVQTGMFQVDPAARSRINTAYVTNNFVCGAIGSGLAGLLWTHGGWSAISIAGGVLSIFAFTVWLIGRRGALTPVERVTD